jgi:Tol biopolymer transport system component
MNTMKWKALLILVVFILVMACGGGNTPKPSTITQEPAGQMEEPTAQADTSTSIPGVTYTGTTLPINALIVFASDRSGNFEIYSSNLDGSDIKQLTDDPGEDAGPELSPDVSKIVFYSTRSGNTEIYVMDVDGGNLVQITDDPADDQMPTWSPNGKVIAFTSNRNGNSDIFLASLDGTQTAAYTDWSSDEIHPTWSPTGPEIAFASTKDGDSEIYIVDSDGKARQLTNNDYVDTEPDWSPNGRFIVFNAEPEKNTSTTTNLTETNLFIIEPDGTGLQQVTSIPGIEVQPTWSPDSNYILFTTLMTGNVDIFMLEENGTFYRITSNETVDTAPSWGPISDK